MRRFAFLLFVGMSTNAHAFRLDQYREVLAKQGGAFRDTAPFVEGRIGRILKLLALGDGGKSLETLRLDGGALGEIYAKRLSTRQRKSSSLLFKARLSRAVVELMRRERYDAPQIFDPSDFYYEILNKKSQARYDFCKQYLDTKPDRFDNFSLLVADYSLIVKDAKAAAAQTGPRSQLDNQLMREIEDYLARFGEQVPGPERISKVLGALANVGYQEGVVTHLTFHNLASVKAEPVFTTISLPSLVTLRTGEDESFLAFLGCFGGEMASALEEGNRAELKAIMTYIKPQFDSDVRGAISFHNVMSRLSPEQLDFLISFMLHLHTRDLPLEAEFAASRPGANEPVDPNSIATLMATRTDTWRGDKGKEAELAVYHNDQFYYGLLSNALYGLETYLTEHRARSGQVNTVITKIKGGG